MMFHGGVGLSAKHALALLHMLYGFNLTPGCGGVTYCKLGGWLTLK